MYEAYFGFQKRPFPSVPQLDLYFPAANTEDARQTLASCIERGAGAGMLIGGSGTGKTLVCDILAEQFKETFATAVLSSGRLSSRRNLLQSILYELGRAYRSMDEGEARLALVDYLTLDENCPDGMLLLVDEAHTLPLRLIDELRMLTNICRDGKPMVRLVLFGNCALEERLANPKLDSFSQRLVARCYLESLNRSETVEYIQTLVASCRGDRGDLFAKPVCEAVHQATDGVPRLINQVCDHALLLVLASGRTVPTIRDIEEAWADLQQLPVPCDSSDEEGGGVIEFGGLDDSFDDAIPNQTQLVETGQPELRINPDTSESTLEPTRQLDRIEEALAGLEDGELEDGEFTPAGSIGPEIELVFEDAPNPFKEEFAEEEVVSERYRDREDSSEREVAAEEEADGYATTDDESRMPETVPMPEPVAASVAMKREYRQLFAKLRRG